MKHDQRTAIGGGGLPTGYVNIEFGIVLPGIEDEQIIGREIVYLLEMYLPGKFFCQCLNLTPILAVLFSYVFNGVSFPICSYLYGTSLRIHKEETDMLVYRLEIDVLVVHEIDGDRASQSENQDLIGRSNLTMDLVEIKVLPQYYDLGRLTRRLFTIRAKSIDILGGQWKVIIVMVYHMSGCGTKGTHIVHLGLVIGVVMTMITL